MMGCNLRDVLCFLTCLSVVIASPRYRRASDLSSATSSFGILLYKQLASDNQTNIIFSPLSVYIALAMTLLGAGGEMEQELRTTLFVQPGQNIHCDLYKLLTCMTINDTDSNLKLRLANALYYDSDQVTVLDSFANNVARYYRVVLRPFQTPNPEEAINTWLEEVTEGAINNFLSPGAITSATVLMLLNAVFFEAPWRTMFDTSFTREANFTTISGTTKQVSMMYRESEFSVKNARALKARVLELPYQGGNYSLFIILPKTKTGLRDVESKLAAKILEETLTCMPRPRRYKVYVPKFALRMGKDLIESLHALGLRAIFDSLSANFSGMVCDAQGLAVSQVLHESMIEVTESGTRTAAVTLIKAVRRLAVARTVQADHAFLFVLRDVTKGVNLFMGRVADPSRGDQ